VEPLISAHNIPAEQALLGVLIEAPRQADTCGITPADLSPLNGHDVILGAILNVAATKGTADPVLLLQELSARDQLNRIGAEADRGAGYLHTLIQAGRNAINAPHYVQLVRAATVRRRFYEYGTRLAQIATSEADIETMLDNGSAVTAALQLLADAPIDGDAPIAGFSTVGEFINEPSPPHSWVIPGLLEHADRVMVVAGEGVGKSVLSRQVGVMLAAGTHPFAPKVAIPPKRVLLVDLENPPALVRRGLQGVVQVADDAGLEFGDRLYRWNRPGGMDLRSAAGRALLHQALDRARPDLVCIGPLYKMSLGRSGDTYETAAAETAAAIDAARERYGCAFWIEHHMAKGEAGQRPSSPLGSSLWMRWPEFGLVLKRAENAEPTVFQLGRFRGDRDDRVWPDRLIKKVGPWPWTADFDDPYELARVLHETDAA
jgi:replicative DNA helicase